MRGSPRALRSRGARLVVGPSMPKKKKQKREDEKKEKKEEEEKEELDEREERSNLLRLFVSYNSSLGCSK